jgi:hypothetical protein
VTTAKVVANSVSVQPRAGRLKLDGTLNHPHDRPQADRRLAMTFYGFDDSIDGCIV